MKHSKKNKKYRRRRTLKRIRHIPYTNIYISGGAKNKTYSFYNRFHYGDNILNLKFLYNISKELKNDNIKINYYYEPLYIKNIDELQRYVDNDVLTLDILSNKPNDAIELWMNNPINNTSYMNDFNIYYDLFYKNILNILGLNNLNINTSLYQKEDYLQDIYNNINKKFHNLDILFINAEPKSGQFNYDNLKMNAVCIKLADKYNIATTSPVNSSIKCTFSDGLKIQDIGAISTHVKYIIAVNSGPICACFTEATKQSVKKWIILDKNNYKYNNINYMLIKSIDELDNIEEYLK